MKGGKISYVRFTSVTTFYVRQTLEKTGFDQKIGAGFFYACFLKMAFARVSVAFSSACSMTWA